MLLAADWQMIGSLADWATTGVALAAFIVAAVAAKFTAQTNRPQQETLELQRKQYQDAREQLRRSQAEKITFWDDQHEKRSRSQYLRVSYLRGKNDLCVHTCRKAGTFS